MSRQTHEQRLSVTLWRVDICGVSHRYVEVESNQEARQAVVEAPIASFDLRASEAAPWIARAYDKAGPIQRKNMLAQIDGLTNPRERRSARNARRQLERMDERAEAEREWVTSATRKAPPVSPEVADQLAQRAAVYHTEESYLRVPEWERHSPIHGS